MRSPGESRSFVAAAVPPALVLASLLAVACGPSLRGPAHAARFDRCPGAYPKTPAGQVVFATMCVEAPELAPPPYPLELVTAAAQVAGCVGSGACVARPAQEPGGREPSHGFAREDEPRRFARQLASAAVAWDLATRVEPDALARALAAEPLNAELRRAFVARYRAARAVLASSIEGLDPRWRAVFLEPAVAARERWAADEATLASWGPRTAEASGAAAAASKDALPARIADLTALRREYWAACAPVRGVDLCLVDPHARALTLAIGNAALAAGDHALVHAEQQVLALRGVDASVLEFRAARAAMMAEAARRTSWAADRGRDFSAEALARKWPTEPFDVVVPEPGRDRTRSHTFGSPALASDIPDAWRPAQAGLETEVAVVRKVVRRGDRAIVQFKKEVIVSKVADCWDSKRIDRIENGNVVYQRDCSDRVLRTDRQDNTRPDADLPWTEGRTLAAGQTVRLILEPTKRRGHLVASYRPFANHQRSVVTGGRRTVERTVDSMLVFQLRDQPIPAPAHEAVGALWREPW